MSRFWGVISVELATIATGCLIDHGQAIDSRTSSDSVLVQWCLCGAVSYSEA